jgi:hypothetical protein
MKHLLLALLLASAATARADSPEAILRDYRKQTVAALGKVNGMLEKAAKPIIAQLIASGDTDGAELLASQLKFKLESEPVVMAQASAALLFTQYDSARLKAVEPLQKSSIARIESMLKAPGGVKLETMTELSRARAEIETGNVASDFDWKKTWAFHYETKNSPENGKVVFNADGSAVYTSKVGNKTLGNWKYANKANSIRADFPNDEWLVTYRHTGVELRLKSTPMLVYLTPVELP